MKGREDQKSRLPNVQVAKFLLKLFYWSCEWQKRAKILFKCLSLSLYFQTVIVCIFSHCFSLSLFSQDLFFFSFSKTSQDSKLVPHVLSLPRWPLRQRNSGKAKLVNLDSIYLFFKWAKPQHLFVYFRSFQTQCCRNN